MEHVHNDAASYEDDKELQQQHTDCVIDEKLLILT